MNIIPHVNENFTLTGWNIQDKLYIAILPPPAAFGSAHFLESFRHGWVLIVLWNRVHFNSHHVEAYLKYVFTIGKMVDESNFRQNWFFKNILWEDLGLKHPKKCGSGCTEFSSILPERVFFSRNVEQSWTWQRSLEGGCEWRRMWFKENGGHFRHANVGVVCCLQSPKRSQITVSEMGCHSIKRVILCWKGIGLSCQNTIQR